jgi:GNAT superfamily N-acetyltransferase
MVKVEAVKTKRDLRGFIKLPWRLYQNDKYWVPPLFSERYETLDQQRNPFFEHSQMQLFVARVDGVVVGRVGAIRNHLHNQVHRDRVGFFGFFESTHEPEIARQLLEAVTCWLARTGCDRVRGPVSPSTNDECGLLVDGFEDQPRFLMPYNPKYYAELIEGAGFQTTKQLWAYKIRRTDILQSERIRKISKIAHERYDLRIRPLNMKSLATELGTIRGLYNQAWSKNWGFVPITEAEAAFMARRLKMLIEPSLVLFAEVSGKPVGVAFVMLDYNEILKDVGGRLLPLGWIKLLTRRGRIKWVRLLLIGVLAEWRTCGIDAALYYELAQSAGRLGIELCEGSWVLEDNFRMNRIMPTLGAEIYKRFNLYEKVLQ